MDTLAKDQIVLYFKLEVVKPLAEISKREEKLLCVTLCVM